MEFIVPILFFIIAFIYSSVGLGGGSSYTALMFIIGVNTLAIPTISLFLNLFVTTLGSYNFLRNKHGKLEIIMPFLVSAIPFAYLGGTFNLPKEIFLWILLISLILVVLRIYFWDSDKGIRINLSKNKKIILSLFIGSILGLISGIVGIGGGIYLVPIIIIFNIGTQKQAAAAAAVFIWMVSISGIASRLQYNTINLIDYMPIILAVIFGGFLGSYMGSFKFNQKTMEKILTIIILIAIILLIKKILF